MKKWVTVVLMLVIVLTLIACGNSNQSSLIGRWEMTNISGEFAVEYRFLRDNRVSLTVADRVDSYVLWGNWNSSNGTVTIEMDDGQVDNFIYRISGSELTLTIRGVLSYDRNYRFQRVR